MSSLYELQQAGPQPSSTNPVHQRALDIAATHDAAIAKVRADSSLSPDGRAAAMAPHYLRAKTDMAKLQEQTAQDTAQHVARLHRQAFGAPNGAVESMSYRDAVGRADAVNDPSLAAHLMERAMRMGDELQARALAQRASEMGWHRVLSTYTDTHPDAAAALTELAARSTGAMMQGLADAGHYYVPKPNELAHLQDHEISAYVARHGG